MLNSVEFVKQILIKDVRMFLNRPDKKVIHPIFGTIITNAKDDDWKRLRTIVNPIFSSGKLKKMQKLIEEEVSNLFEIFDKHSDEGKEANVFAILSNFSLDVIAKCAFGVRTNTNKDPNNTFVVNVRNNF